MWAVFRAPPHLRCPQCLSVIPWNVLEFETRVVASKRAKAIQSSFAWLSVAGGLACSGSRLDLGTSV